MSYLACKCALKNTKFRESRYKNKVSHLQFDDLITTEHTKLKTLSISIVVDVDRRFILGSEVSKIPAFGHLAALSRQKYGYRKSTHKEGLDRLFQKIRPVVDQKALIGSKDVRT